MTTPYLLHAPLPPLQRRVLIVNLSGWIDASGAGSAALATIDQVCNTIPLVTFDSDTFIDYRARRPIMEVRDGVNAGLVWSEIRLRHGVDAQGNAIVTLSGPEPDAQWHKFTSAVTHLATELGVHSMVSLGAYPFATPHTRPPRLSGTSPSPHLAAKLPYIKSTIDVPAGIVSVLEHSLADAGIDALGMWVQVPHYISALAFPAASVALLHSLRDLADVHVDTHELEREAITQCNLIERLVAGNDEHVAMVRQLEHAYDQNDEQTMSLGSADLPTGDDLAAEFERFLRDQGQ